MPVKQLPALCWTDDGSEDERHYDDPGGDRRQLAAPCFIAECDGRPGEPCGEQMGNDEYAVLHFGSVTVARSYAPDEDWAISPDGVVSCPEEASDA